MSGSCSVPLPTGVMSDWIEEAKTEAVAVSVWVSFSVASISPE